MKKLFLSLFLTMSFFSSKAQFVDMLYPYIYAGMPENYETERDLYYYVIDSIYESIQPGDFHYRFKFINSTKIKRKQSQIEHLQDSLDSRIKLNDLYAWAKQPNAPSYSKADVGLSNSDNTSDLSKPISIATQTALNSKLSTEVDGSVTNELQTISKVGDNLTISNGNTIALGIPLVKRQESYSGTTNSSGQYTVVFSSSYSVTPNIQANIIGAPDNQNIRITSVGTTGFTVTVRNRVDVVGLLPTWSDVNGASVDVLVTQK